MNNKNINDLYDKLDSIDKKLQNQIDIENDKKVNNSIDERMNTSISFIMFFTSIALIALIILHGINNSSSVISFTSLLLVALGVLKK